jgi:multicomponent Na+:H+ antiporter subunit A
VSGLLTFADRSVSIIQSGSLPAYLGIIASVVITVPAIAVASGVVDTPIAVPAPGSGLELVLGVFVIVAAIAIPFVGRRFAAMILLGGVGYGVAGIFAAFGGPDLALTQVLVETLVLALFALVLRHLPAHFTLPRTPRAPRVLIAVAVAAFVFAGGLLTNSVTVDDPVSDAYIARSEPDAGGANVVNVILVDFRGFDTLGEITVLVTAALGAASLVVPFIRRRRQEPQT